MKTTKGSGSSKFFARGNHTGGGNPPSVKVSRAPDGATPAATVAKGQFGNPSGKSGASPLSLINGALKGAGHGKLNAGVPGGMRGPYGKVRVR